MPATYDREKQAFSKGEPEYGAHFADELERLVNLHGANTIAAVIVEPMAGSTGVLPAPKGYLKRLREITQKHGILLIFDEVITGYGRLGFAFAAERYGVLPDMLTFAKGITNGAAPMGGVMVRDTIHDAFMSGPEHVVELTHGYTYSAHPLGLRRRRLPRSISTATKSCSSARNKLEPKFADAVMSLKGQPNVVDIRTVGLTAGIDLAPVAGCARQARLRRAQQRLPRQRPDAARRRRHAGADAAADRHRGPDRRDRRKGRQGDPRGGVGFLPRSREERGGEHIATTAPARNIQNLSTFMPRQRTISVPAGGGTETCSRLRATCCAPGSQLEAQPGQAGDAVLLCATAPIRRPAPPHPMPVAAGLFAAAGHFPDRRLPGRHHGAVSLG